MTKVLEKRKKKNRSLEQVLSSRGRDQKGSNWHTLSRKKTLQNKICSRFRSLMDGIQEPFRQSSGIFRHDKSAFFPPSGTGAASLTLPKKKPAYIGTAPFLPTCLSFARFSIQEGIIRLNEFKSFFK